MNHAKQGFNVTIEIGHASRWHRIRPGNVHRAVSCFQKACAMHLARAGRLPLLLAKRQILARYAGSLVLALLLETGRSEEHTSELQSLMRISYAVFCLKKKKKKHDCYRNT